MRVLLTLFTVTIALFASCTKADVPVSSPTPQFARIHFLHKFTTENIRDLTIHRYTLTGGQWKLTDSAKTNVEGMVQFSYPADTQYQLRVVSDIYVTPVYQMIPARNSGLLTLVGETDCWPHYMGSADVINKFRVFLY